MDRKKFFGAGLGGLAKDFLRSPAGAGIQRRLEGISNVLDPRGLDFFKAEAARREKERAEQQGPAHWRPPGALPDDRAFLNACTRCGDCIEACPHDTLFQLADDSGPLLDPNTVACHLCPDTPCIAACETTALNPLPTGALPKFGTAVLEPAACLNFDRPKGGRICRDCLPACPVPDVIGQDRAKMPLIDATGCTGCGLCVEACPAEPVALQVR